MRLGVVMTGVGAYAAANAGVLRALSQRGIEPYAVCGIHAGAWPAALFALGQSTQDVEKALQQAALSGRRLMAPSVFACMGRRKEELLDGKRIERMLLAQTGHRVLSLCEKPAVFPCRMLRTGYRVAFSTRTYAMEPGAMLAMQASVSFAARCAMTLPPYLGPLTFMGSTLLAESDTAFACRQLFALGAHRVLVVRPVPSPRVDPDPLVLTGAMLQRAQDEKGQEHVGVLSVAMPDCCGAIALERAQACGEAGYEAARRELDSLFEHMGMAFCRVLPFRRPARLIGSCPR